MWRKVLQSGPYPSMVAVTAGTLGSAAAILNPYTDTFDGRGWRYIAALRLEAGWFRITPGEDSWGAVLLLLGACMWLSSWLKSRAEDDEQDGNHPGPLSRAVSFFCLSVWIVGAGVWGAISVGIALGFPGGILTIWLVVVAALSIFNLSSISETHKRGGSGGA